jgi:NitT/TauT family transport system permease protein
MKLLSLLDRAAPLLTFIGLLLAWEIACRLLAIPPYVLPSPSAIVQAGLSMEGSRWLGHIMATLQVALLGFLIAILIALPLAIGLTSSRLLSRTVLPLLVVVQSTPVVAIAPIIVVTLGAGILPRVVITTMITFFPLVISTAAGLVSVPAELIELSRSLRAPRLREYTQIRLPYGVPYIFSALKVSSTLAVVGAVVAEFVAAERGLGYLIMFSTSSFKVPLAFAALMVLVACSLAVFKLIGLMQRKLFPWSMPKDAFS